MAHNTEISWTDTTWNPLAGCTWASPGCDHCYAAVMARRLEAMARADIAAVRDPGRKQKYIGITNKNSAGRIMFNGKVKLDEAALDEPLNWAKPRRVFVNSMSDLFHKDVPESFIGKVWSTMLSTPQHTYQVLTKRPERMATVVRRLVEEGERKGLRAPDNIWCGTSVENQEQADARIPHLLNVPVKIRFLSCEPLLGPLDLSHVANMGRDAYGLADGVIHWVICGGESGPGARPMHPEWARGLRDQCAAASVAFHFKQWGEYQGIDYAADGTHWRTASGDNTPLDCRPAMRWDDGHGVVRLGKHAAGRLLDGRTWDEFPA